MLRISPVLRFFEIVVEAKQDIALQVLICMG